MIKAESHPAAPWFRCLNPALSAVPQGSRAWRTALQALVGNAKEKASVSPFYLLQKLASSFLLIVYPNMYLNHLANSSFSINISWMNEWDKIPLPPLTEKNTYSTTCPPLLFQDCYGGFFIMWFNEDKGLYSKSRMWSLYCQERKLLGIVLLTFYCLKLT